MGAFLPLLAQPTQPNAQMRQTLQQLQAFAIMPVATPPSQALEVRLFLPDTTLVHKPVGVTLAKVQDIADTLLAAIASRNVPTLLKCSHQLANWLYLPLAKQVASSGQMLPQTMVWVAGSELWASIPPELFLLTDSLNPQLDLYRQPWLGGRKWVICTPSLVGMQSAITDSLPPVWLRNRTQLADSSLQIWSSPLPNLRHWQAQNTAAGNRRFLVQRWPVHELPLLEVGLQNLLNRQVPPHKALRTNTQHLMQNGPMQYPHIWAALCYWVMPAPPR
jgi:hypothetical protein